MSAREQQEYGQAAFRRLHGVIHAEAKEGRYFSVTMCARSVPLDMVSIGDEPVTCLQCQRAISRAQREAKP